MPGEMVRPRPHSLTSFRWRRCSPSPKNGNGKGRTDQYDIKDAYLPCQCDDDGNPEQDLARLPGDRHGKPDRHIAKEPDERCQDPTGRPGEVLCVLQSVEKGRDGDQDNEGRGEDRSGCHQGPGKPSNQVADKGGGYDDRPTPANARIMKMTIDPGTCPVSPSFLAEAGGGADSLNIRLPAIAAPTMATTMT